MAASQQYTTKELSTKTWPDFEQLFSQGGGWDFCGCMLYQRGCRPAGKQYRSRAAAHDRNLPDKRELVEQDRAHGILVYMSGEAVGWCQYGRTSELPVVRTKEIRERMFAKDPTSQWRITCFVTRKDHRRKGVVLR